MYRIYTGLRGDGKNYLLFHDTKHNNYIVTCGSYQMYTYTTLRAALLKFKEVLYL